MIESINNQLKNVFQIEHTRHRSPVNGFINIIAGLITRIPDKDLCHASESWHPDCCLILALR